MKKKILFVDDDEMFLASIRSLMRKHYNVDVESSSALALQMFQDGAPDYSVIISDMRMPVIDGVELLSRLSELAPDIPRIMLTGFGDYNTAVRALNEGRIMRFLSKPCPFDTLHKTIEAVIEEAERNSMRMATDHAESAGTKIIGDSPAMNQVKTALSSYAEVGSNVLLIGESGTGKELAAEALHMLGPRQNGPLIKVNCPALPENLIESELFGCVKGAYTGADSDRIGRFQAAEGGTLFLDEIGDLPLSVQVKLLRAIEYKEFEPVGDCRTIRCDVRIVAATNRDLPAMVENDSFRTDLYYRLKVMTLEMPPLRNRGRDVILLAEHFLKYYAFEFSKNIRGFSESAAALLLSSSWPGNVRELKHAIEHAALFCQGDEIEDEHLPGSKSSTEEKPAARLHPESDEPMLDKESILAALMKTDGNKAKAARLLGVGRSTLYRHLRTLGL